jgi:anti-sigma B factor antagonist
VSGRRGRGGPEPAALSAGKTPDAGISGQSAGPSRYDRCGSVSLAYLSLEHRPLDEGVLIAASGEIDRSTAPRLSDALRRATFGATGPITVDLCEVTFMDSSGVSVLLNAVRRLTRRERRMSLVCPRGELLRLFELSGLSATLDVRTSPPEPAGATRS